MCPLKGVSLVLILFICNHALGDNLIDNAVLFGGCDMDTYYEDLLAVSSDPTSWSSAQLSLLVTETHRKILPLKGPQLGDDDIYNALIDLDYGSEPDTVRLIYRDLNMNATPNANLLYWDRELLWPRHRGSGDELTSTNDIHHLRPADATVLMKKGLLSFGSCSTVQQTEFCVTPATDETAIDTAQDGKIWLPPAKYRGDIARALFYMNIRYDYLTLKDCGPFDNGMGYLSELLQWHIDDPVDEQEMYRSERACSRWQGNRNPFIDYPELAASIYGTPSSVIPGAYTYRDCVNVPTPSPTATADECAELAESGDVPVFLINTDDPDQIIFLPLVNITPMVLYITDQAYDGEKLLSGVENEGTVKWTVEEKIIAGETFGYGVAGATLSSWEPVEGTFSLQEDGDNVFLYCKDADNLIRFISAFTNSGGWRLPGLTAEEYGTNSTALPIGVADTAIMLNHLDNYYFNGDKERGTAALKVDMMIQANWVGSDISRFEIATDSSGGYMASPFFFSIAMLFVISVIV